MEQGYLVRQISRDVFEVSKWDFETEPVAVYKVRQSTKRWLCNSPGCRHSNKCKHVKLILDWEKNKYIGMPDRMIKCSGGRF